MKDCRALVVFGLIWSCASQQPEVGPVSTPREYPVNEPFAIENALVVQGDKRAWVVGPDEIHSNYSGQERVWRRSRDLGDLPVFEAPNHPLLEALTRLALEEALLNVLESGPNAGGFSAGAKWPGVWTRDISYSIHLALAWILPEVSRKSLLLKTNGLPEVIQDTGTGGSWPVSTDRTVWSLAAWELYLTTGDRNWLERSYTILKNTAQRDRSFAWDEPSGLYRGETSFMDWREQTYPRWMSPVDIAESKALGTNILHWHTLGTLNLMAGILGLPRTEAERWKTWAEDLQRSIQTRFSMAEAGYYSAYEYGFLHAGLKSNLSDTLANSLGVLLGAFSRQNAERVIKTLPVVPFGPPIVYPQLPNIPPYHNRAIWPFVTAYYSLAGAEVGNLEAFEFGLKSNLRAAALFLTHKENMVFANGHHVGTQVNSDRQLWSVAGWLAQIYRGLLGLRLTAEGLHFKPTVPYWVQGPLRLRGLVIRGASLDLTVEGNGDMVRSLTVNGSNWDLDRTLPYPQPGQRLDVRIVLEGRKSAGGITLGSVDAYGLRPTLLKAQTEGNQVRLVWDDNGHQAPFAVYEMGRKIASLEGLVWQQALTETRRALSFTVRAEPLEGYPSLYSNSALVYPPQTRIEIPAIGGTYPEGARQTALEELGLDRDYLHLEGTVGEKSEWNVDIPRAGLWLLRFRYGNGSGPISTDNKCALRTVTLNGTAAGKAIFPQTGNWTDRVWSVITYLKLRPGRNRIGLSLSAEDSNMDGSVNEVVLDTLELVLIQY